jgi:hypothetical protein
MFDLTLMGFDEFESEFWTESHEVRTSNKRRAAFENLTYLRVSRGPFYQRAFHLSQR